MANYKDQVSCKRREEVFQASTWDVEASLTNFIGGEVINDQLPGLTRTVWVSPTGLRLTDELDAEGCRHWLEKQAFTSYEEEN